MNRSILALTVPLWIAACHGASPTASVEQVVAPAPEAAPAPAPAPESDELRAELERDVAHAAGITEVVLDPRGEAALTLDADGGVRLWPQLRADVAASAPYRIPIHEPLWSSLGKRADGGFLLGFIGTNNAGAVYRVERPEAGPATIVEGFSLSPEDPLLELHVLDGGERVLALGVDHRVRLYAADGSLISELDERSFGPWQLRVSGGVGEAPKLLAVLAQPLRVQPLRLVDDRLEIAGPARDLELDRGPNRNDLALSPDGTTVAALRRPHKHDPQWSVELIDLATDTRELIAGRVDTKVRPRMHFSENDRLLLESGSGQAWSVDLAEAVTPRRAEDLDPDSKFAKRLARALAHTVVALPASGEQNLGSPDDDEGVRMHASVVNGVRAGIDVHAGRRLVVGALAEQNHLSFAHRRASMVDASFDASGTVLVWAADRAIYVERVGEPDSLVIHEHELGIPLGVAVTGPARAVILSRYAAGEIDLESGELRERVNLPSAVSWTPNSRFDGATLGYLTEDINTPIWLLELGHPLAPRVARADELRRFGDLRSVDDRSTKRLCDEFGAPCSGERFAQDHAGLAMYADDSGLHLYDAPERFHEQGAWTSIPLLGTRTTALSPSPVGSTVAVARRVRFEESVLSVVDTQTGELRWSTTIPHREVSQLRWSADGRRLAVVAPNAGLVFDVEGSTLLHARTSLPLEIVELD